MDPVWLACLGLALWAGGTGSTKHHLPLGDHRRKKFLQRMGRKYVQLSLAPLLISRSCN